MPKDFNRLRWLLAITSLAIFLIVIPLTISKYVTTSKFFNQSNPVIIPDRPYNDLTDGGMQIKVNLSNNLFQVGLLIVAALAGLLIAKDKEAGFVLSDPPEILMFGCASLLLLLSFVFHDLYLNEIGYVYSLAGKLYEAARPSVPDIFDDKINFLLRYQFWYLLSGLLLALFTFLSAHKLKGGKKTCDI